MKELIFTQIQRVLNAGFLALFLVVATQQHAHAQCTLVCNDLLQVSLNADCEAEILPDDILEGGGCPNGDLQVQAKINGVWVPAVGNFVATSANLNQTLQIRVRDLISGNSCTSSILVQDKIKPQLTCNDLFLNCAVTNYTPAYLYNELELENGYPIVDENCGTYTLSFIDTWYDLGCNGSINGHTDISYYIIRKWTAVDGSANSSTCNQYIYFERRHTIDLELPEDFTVSCEDPNVSPAVTGVPYIFEFGVQWPVWPNSGFCELNAIYQDNVIRLCDGTTKILRTWTIHDWCQATGQNNPLIHVQLIKILDDQPPVAECPENMTVGTNPNDCHLDFNLPDFMVEDACSRLASVEAQWTDYNGHSHSTFGSFTSFPGNNLWHPDTLAVLGYANDLPIGDNLIKYIITDDCGNSAVCQFIVTVVDDVPPVASCDQTTVVAMGPDDPFDCYLPSANGCEFAGVTWVKASTFNDGSYDECNNIKFTIRRMAPYSDCIESLNKVNGHPNCNDAFPDFPSEYERATAEGDSIKFYCCEVGTVQTVILRVYQLNPDGSLSIGYDGEPIYNECMIQVEVQDKLKPECVAPAHVTVSCEQFDPSLWLYGKAAVS
ncbi:MAG: HYR domain-containing protein, partial [Saprospiraceae bacterium]|nr:HYR domain-containing protein [Saprospiraceae bacterium]